MKYGSVIPKTYTRFISLLIVLGMVALTYFFFTSNVFMDVCGTDMECQEMFPNTSEFYIEVKPLMGE